MPKISTETVTGPQLESWHNANHRNDLVGFSFWGGYRWIEPLKFNVNIDTHEYWRNWYYKVEWQKRDPTIALLRQISVGGMESAGWSVKIEGDVPDELTDYATKETQRIHSMCMRQAGMGCTDYGWAPFERVFKYDDDGMICIEKLKSLMQSMTLIETDDDTGEFTGLSQEDIVLDPTECVLFNFDVEGTNWYGRAPMMAAEKPFDSEVQINNSRHKMNRRIAASHWIIYYPIGKTPSTDPDLQKDDEGKADNFHIANKIMERLLEDGSVAVPNEIRSELHILNEGAYGGVQNDEYQSWRIELLGGDSAGSATFYTDQLRYEDALKCRAFGIPERAILEGQYGTKAEADAHGDVAIIIMEQRNEELTKPATELLRDEIEWNFGEQYRDQVSIKANPLVDKQRAALKELYAMLLQNPDILLEQYDITDMREIREKLKIPTLEETEEGNLDNVMEIQKQKIENAQDAMPAGMQPGGNNEMENNSGSPPQEDDDEAEEPEENEDDDDESDES